MNKDKIPKILKQNPIQSLKDWKRGFNELTPMDHALAKRAGHFWGYLGALMASLSLLIQVPYSDPSAGMGVKAGFGILVGAISYLQFCEWREENQKIYGLEKMKELIKQQEVA